MANPTVGEGGQVFTQEVFPNAYYTSEAITVTGDLNDGHGTEFKLMQFLGKAPYRIMLQTDADVDIYFLPMSDEVRWFKWPFVVGPGQIHEFNNFAWQAIGIRARGVNATVSMLACVYNPYGYTSPPGWVNVG